MTNRNLITLAILTTSAVALLALLAQPTTARATTGWDWWDAIYAQQNHLATCPASPPDKDDWEDALDTADDPHFTELTAYFIAYPCSANPGVFLEFREWLNYEVHDVGVWDSNWTGYKFYDTKELVLELDETGAGFWDDGPWGG